MGGSSSSLRMSKGPDPFLCASGGLMTELTVRRWLPVLHLELVVDADDAVHRAGDPLGLDAVGLVVDLTGERDDAVGRVHLDVGERRELDVGGQFGFYRRLDARVVDLTAGRRRRLAAR